MPQGWWRVTPKDVHLGDYGLFPEKKKLRFFLFFFANDMITCMTPFFGKKLTNYSAASCLKNKFLLFKQCFCKHKTTLLLSVNLCKLEGCSCARKHRFVF